MLPIKIQRIPEMTEDFQMLQKYMSNGRIAAGNNASFPNKSMIANIFRVDDTLVRSEDDTKVFENLHNHWLLFHGTKNENLLGILEKGLRIKPI